MLSTHNRGPIHSLSSQETTHTPLLCYCHRLWSYRQPVSATKLSAVTSTWSSLYRPLYGSISLLPLLSYDPYRCHGFSCLNSRVFSEFFFCMDIVPFFTLLHFVTLALYSLVCCPSYPCRAAHGLSAVLPTFNFNVFYESISSLPRNIISWDWFCTLSNLGLW